MLSEAASVILGDRQRSLYLIFHFQLICDYKKDLLAAYNTKFIF